MTDIIVIGSGPNGLVAANYLARAGYSVLVLEAQPTPGGAVRTREVTLPGFRHDLGAAFFPFGQLSPALQPLDLEGAGLVWKHAPYDSAHPSSDGSVVGVSRDLDRTLATMNESDGERWRNIHEWHQRTRERLLNAILAPLPALGPGLRLGPGTMLRLLEVALASGRGLSERWFESPEARRIFPGLALHTDVGPDDPFGAVVGFVLGIMATSGGFAVPEWGAESITRALLKRFDEEGGALRCSARVTKILVRGGEAVGVQTQTGEVFEATRGIIADVAAPSLYLDLLDRAHLPSTITNAMQSFQQGFGTFKMDWAIRGPMPWRDEISANAAVVHAGDDLDDLSRFTAQVRAGQLPEHPYLVIGQQSLCDPRRAPRGHHTLWAYSRVPSRVPGGWEATRQRFADRVEARIEELAPGFRQRIMARAIFSPDDLESINENLIGGDLGGGSAQLHRQLIFRPIFPYFRYRTPIRGLYLGSSYAHPGAGVHGACGKNAAMALMADA